jgi:hypothetical protein
VWVTTAFNIGLFNILCRYYLYKRRGGSNVGKKGVHIESPAGHIFYIIDSRKTLLNKRRKRKVIEQLNLLHTAQKKNYYKVTYALLYLLYKKRPWVDSPLFSKR